MAQSSAPRRAGRRRARRGGRAHGDLLRPHDEGHADDTVGETEGRRDLDAGPARPQPARRAATSAACASSSRAWSGGSTSCPRTSPSSTTLPHAAHQPTDAMPPTLNPLDLVTRINRDVERSLLRARNGVRYVRGTHAPKVGVTPKEVVWQRGKAQLWRYRNGPVALRPAGADRPQPRQPQLHPRPAAWEQPRRVPDRRRARRVPARLGRPGRARCRQRPRALRRLLPAARGRGRPARERLRRGDASPATAWAASSPRCTRPATTMPRSAT